MIAILFRVFLFFLLIAGGLVLLVWLASYFVGPLAEWRQRQVMNWRNKYKKKYDKKDKLKK